jgi:hypothetical protein
MRSRSVSLRSLLVALCGCALNAQAPAPIVSAPSVANGCGAAPVTPLAGFRHVSSQLAAGFGGPRHRGVDLIASATDHVQILGGKLAYGPEDKALVGEDVVLFACSARGWRELGRTRTDAYGRFAVSLTGGHRLAVGTRDLYATAPDGTGVRFLAFVAQARTRVLVTDIDGTLTRSEGAIFETVLAHRDIDSQPGAAAGIAHSGYPVVYVSGRGDQYTAVTRRWLAQHGFPRGPLRLAPASLTMPHVPTVEYKQAVLRALPLPIGAAIGNRASDITAYAAAGVPAGRIFIHLPEFASEVRAAIAACEAVGFTDYRELDARIRAARAGKRACGERSYDGFTRRRERV